MSQPAAPQRSRVPWALALAVGLASLLAGYVIHAALIRRSPKQVVEVRRLTDMPGRETSPAISPDGKMIAFAAGGQVWIQPVAGSPRALIGADDLERAEPRWTPDSKGLIYFNQEAIWEIQAAGGEARRLVDAMAPGDLSHAGKTLAFFRQGVELVAGDRIVVKVAAGATYSNLRWSPDDKKIAYLRNTELMVVSVSGGEPVKATDMAVQGFTWAPDGSGLIVSMHGELWFVPRVEGRTPSQLTFGELAYESPDIDSAGNIVISRRSLDGSETDIVLFSGLKW